MQNRYAGDIGDFGKLGLLRQLQAAGFDLGINWYLVPDESHNEDGRHISYLDKASFRLCDAELWDHLRAGLDAQERSIAMLESRAVPTAVCHSDILDFQKTTKTERLARRSRWHEAALRKLGRCDMVFLDPDNGLIVPSAKDGPKSNKYVLPEEIWSYYRAGNSVIYYQHKARLPDSFYLAQQEQLVCSGGSLAAESLTLKFKTTSQRYYCFLLQKSHVEAVHDCVARMMDTAWKKHFDVLSPLGQKTIF